MQRKSNDTAGMIGKKYFDNYLTRQKLELIDERVRKPIEKYRRAMKRIFNIFRVFKPKKKDQNDYKKNPMYKLYLVTIAFWIYLVYLIYYKLIIKSHFDQTI